MDDFLVVTHGPRRRLRIGRLVGLHPEDTLYPAHDTANDTAHNRADWPGAPVAFVDAMRDTAGYSLGACSEWSCERGNHSNRNQSLSFHQVDPLFVFGSKFLPRQNGGWTARSCLKKGMREAGTLFVVHDFLLPALFRTSRVVSASSPHCS